MADDTKKLTFAQLALADWLSEDSDNRFASVFTDQFTSKSLSLYQIEGGEVVELTSSIGKSFDTALLDRLGGTLEIDYSPLVAAKMVTGHNSRYKRPDGTPNAFTRFSESIAFDGQHLRAGSIILRHTKQSLETWNSVGRAEFEGLRKKREEARAAVSRTVIIGARCVVSPHIDQKTLSSFPTGFKHPLPDLRIVRPVWKARVVRETKERLYVQDISRIIPSETGTREEWTVHGRAPNQYVNRTDVLVDGARDGTAEKLSSLDFDRLESYRNACVTLLEATLGPLLSFHSRTLQADAMHDDLMKEAIEEGTVER